MIVMLKFKRFLGYQLSVSMVNGQSRRLTILPVATLVAQTGALMISQYVYTLMAHYRPAEEHWQRICEWYIT